MTNANPITSLINRWSSRRELADQIGVSVAVVHKWAEHGRIPADRQFAVVRAASANGFGDVTSDWMLINHAQNSPAKAPENSEAVNG